MYSTHCSWTGGRRKKKYHKWNVQQWTQEGAPHLIYFCIKVVGTGSNGRKKPVWINFESLWHQLYPWPNTDKGEQGFAAMPLHPSLHWINARRLHFSPTPSSKHLTQQHPITIPFSDFPFPHLSDQHRCSLQVPFSSWASSENGRITNHMFTVNSSWQTSQDNSTAFFPPLEKWHPTSSSHCQTHTMCLIFQVNKIVNTKRWWKAQKLCREKTETASRLRSGWEMCLWSILETCLLSTVFG